MKVWKIPVKVYAIAEVTVEAETLPEAVMKAMHENEIERSDVVEVIFNIPIIDEERVALKYPKEVADLKESEKPLYEKRGWKSTHRGYEKNGFTITNDFENVNHGFDGTVHMPNGMRYGGFDSLESAIGYAESKM